MAENFTYVLIKQWGGLVTRVPDSQLGPGEASDAENVRSVTGKEIRKRKGYVALNGTALTDSWTSKTAMTAAKTSMSLVQLASFLYCPGGAAGGVGQTTNFQYDIRLNVWATKTAMVISDFTYFSWGVNGLAVVASNVTVAYSPVSDTWASRQSPNQARDDGASFTVSDLAYMSNGDGTTTRMLQRYNAVVNTWATLTASTGGAKRVTQAGGRGTNVGFEQGGWDGTTVEDSVARYNVSVDTWTIRASTGFTKYRQRGMSIGNFFYVTGGVDASTVFANVYRFDDLVNTWTAMTNMLGVRAAHGASESLSVGWVVGGVETVSTTAIATMEMYNPPVCVGLYDFQQSNLKRSIIVGTPVQLSYWTGIALSSLGSSFTGTYLNPWSFVNYNDVLYATNGADTMQKWNGVDTATVTVQGNIYQTRTALTTARSNVAAFTLGINGFVAGGTTGSVSAVNERYDDLPNTWTARGSMNTARSFLGGFTQSNHGYVTGGSTGSVSAVTEQFSEVTNIWRAVANNSAARSGLACSVSTLYGYCSGGTTGSVSAKHDQYDPALNTWTNKTDLATARQDVAAGTVTAQHVFGGSTGSDSAVNERYSESGNSWTTRSAMVTARDLLGSMFATEGIIEDLYSVGGHVSAVSAITNRYRYATDIWISRANLGTARSGVAGFGLSKKGFACGGTTGSVSGVVEKYFAGATPPVGRFLVVQRGYGILGGNFSYPSRRYWSALGDLDNWPPENFEDIASDDGDVQTGSFVFHGNEYYCKHDRVYLLPWSDDPGDFQVLPLQDGVGVTNQQGIVQTNGKVYFRGERAFYEFDGNFRRLSDPIESTVLALNASLSDITVGIDNKRLGEIWWSVASANAVYNDTVLAYSYKLSTPERPVWFRYTNINASVMAEIEDRITDLPTVYHGNYQGVAYYHDESVDNDAGTAITSSWTSGWLAVNPNEVDPLQLRRLLTWVESTTGAGSLTMDVYTNFITTAIESPTVTLASTNRVLTNVIGNTLWALKFKLSHSTASQSWQINKLGFGLTPTEEDRLE